MQTSSKGNESLFKKEDYSYTPKKEEKEKKYIGISIQLYKCMEICVNLKQECLDEGTIIP